MQMKELLKRLAGHESPAFDNENIRTGRCMVVVYKAYGTCKKSRSKTQTAVMKFRIRS